MQCHWPKCYAVHDCISFPFPPVLNVSVEKSTDSFNGVTLYVISLFSLAVFQNSLTFDSLIIMCYSVTLFGFSVFGVHGFGCRFLPPGLESFCHYFFILFFCPFFFGFCNYQNRDIWLWPISHIGFLYFFIFFFLLLWWDHFKWPFRSLNFFCIVKSVVEAIEFYSSVIFFSLRISLFNLSFCSCIVFLISFS